MGHEDVYGCRQKHTGERAAKKQDFTRVPPGWGEAGVTVGDKVGEPLGEPDESFGWHVLA